MPAYPAVTCSHCEKKFKPKTDVAGKKIKCPFCKEAISVPAADVEPKRASDKGKKAKSKGNGKPKAASAVEAAPEVQAAPEAAPVAPAAAAAGSFDSDENPYTVVSQDLRRLCPSCATEMASANAIICLKCGYNTMTREVNRTETVLARTTKQRVMHLLPAAGAATFLFFLVVFQIFFAVVAPVVLGNTMFSFTDAEWARMWSTLLFLTWFWAGGMFCFKVFAGKPLPDEVKTS